MTQQHRSNVAPLRPVGEVDDAPISSTGTSGRKRLSPRRAGLRREVARAVGAAIAATSSVRSIAAACDVSPSLVERWTSPEDGAALSIADLMTAGRHGERGFAAAVVTAMVALLGEVRGPGLSAERHALNVVSEVGDVVREVQLAIADGVVDEAELVRLLREIHEAIGSLEAMKADMQRELERARAKR